MQRFAPGLALLSLLANAHFAVRRVSPGSPAAQAGLAKGDVITALDDKPVASALGYLTLAIGSDDGTRLLLDGELSAENDGIHPIQFSSGRTRLQKDLHAVRIEFFEATGEADLQLTLSRDGSSKGQDPKCYFDGPR
jgi:hypothetical protein